ncbi:probable 3-deoxy-D-manno-octulosonic acid transferase, mitochondrial isoform X2 [Mercurialis annua]|uniref:probable 3-deoxy-D-manno-octulosonic acid transferase, mitochondrial isoform X2 n=1 Tax=Mercurialis annua TaxID=3986 RepID=UPI00215E5DE9|nr:probable 3-deoxy-D-manno-octulosonic acid transferase, mitochondrial isoform X2 [Mercurialis annua]
MAAGGGGGTGNTGMLLYKLYRAISYGITPLVHLHIQWRRLRGLEHPNRWPERLGRSSLPRPAGDLLWFHAVSLGEGMAAIPVIKREVIKNQLPNGVLYQFSPLDTPVAVDTFLDYWKPNAIVILESELWPNLVMGSSRKGILLALLNARVSKKSFRLWSQPMLLPLVSLMLSKFSLIIPLSNFQGIHFQLLHAPPAIINFAGDLKYAVEYDTSMGDKGRMEDLKEDLNRRQVWMAASIHRGEEKVMLDVRKALVQAYPDIVTIIVPRYPQHGKEIAQQLQSERKIVALRSQQERITAGTQVYIVDSIGELRHLYVLSPIAVIGGSFLPGLAGHNISEAAAAGCAVLTGHHIGHFSHMVKEMQRKNPLSVMQVSGTLELQQTIMKLLNDAEALKAQRMAAKQAFRALSSGIVANAWNLLNVHVIETIVRK